MKAVLKNILKFLRSMRFGMILLILMVLCSLAGSLIVQGKDAAYYQAQYPALASAIMALQFDHVFSSWYFIAITAMLCVNLLCCSVLRLGRMVRQYRAMPSTAARAALRPLPCSREKVEEYLRFHRFRPKKGVWMRNRLGHYGTFTVHLALIVLLLAAAAGLYLPTTETVTLHTGESAELAEGLSLRLDAFQTLNAEGDIDYVSSVTATDANGERQSEISVNFPLTIGGIKVYQSNCGADGQITVIANGQPSVITMTGDDWGAFLTLDGETGVTYEGLFPDYQQDAEAGVAISSDTSRGYVNPIYRVYVTDGDNSGTGVVVPDTTLQVGDVQYRFEKPVDYSVFLVKVYPQIVYVLLYLSFVMLIAGIWLAFFCVPTYVRLEDGGYAVTAPKPVPDVEEGLGNLGQKA